MSLRTVMADLKRAGTAQNRKIYARHGAREPMFGVSYGDLNTLAKTHRGQHELGLELFASGNHDARQLAAKIVDPRLITDELADEWVDAVDCYITAEAVAGVVSNAPVARSRSDAWRDLPSEWIASTGWAVLAFSADDESVWSTIDLRILLEQIEAEIHDRPNRVRHEMNMAVITIGLRSPGLRRTAIATAKRIGPVVVDHGETNCKTPDAVGYIEKTVAHRAAKAARHAASTQR